MMNGLNQYDYHARQYDPATIRFTTMDPLVEKYYSISPYVYCANNPIRMIDAAGLYPKSILEYQDAGYYKLREPAAYLLSLVSGQSLKDIIPFKIRMRDGIVPLYDPDEGGGAITLGNLYNKSITLTENYFADNPKAYKNNGYGQNIYEWLDILSHEVGHNKHIVQAGGDEITYSLSFLFEYARYLGHNNSPKEKEADKGQTRFRDFFIFVNENFGANYLINVFNLNNDSQIMQMINKWWDAYKKSNSFSQNVRNFNNLQQGTYVWNGSSWVLKY
ncbi:MAG: RHS repeat-associated core domain-containing protein [Dysgonomonas sp.]